MNLLSLVSAMLARIGTDPIQQLIVTFNKRQWKEINGPYWLQMHQPPTTEQPRLETLNNDVMNFVSNSIKLGVRIFS